MRSRLLACLALAVLAPLACAQTPLRPPTPLLAAPAETLSPGQAAITLEAADRAQEMGFSSIAVRLYRQLLDAPVGTAGDRLQLRVSLVTALLSDGQVEAAEAALDEFTGLRNSAWHLRAGLVAQYAGRSASARVEADAVKLDELSAGDRGWYFLLKATVAEAAGDTEKRNQFYDQASAAAVNELQRTRFALAREFSRLRVGAPSAGDLEKARANAERLQGSKAGYDFARVYAIMLHAAGQKAEAVSVLQRQLQGLPLEERRAAEDFRLLLGLISGAEDGPGRRALFQLLATGEDAAKQRIALRILARASATGAAASEFREQLDELTRAGRAEHPILEDLWLFRAQVALGENDYARAESDAKSLLDRFPGSPLRAHALGVLTSAAWEQRRYRLAADFAGKARQALPEGPARAQLGVLVAEAWFRAGDDYRSAADAYAAVLDAPPPGVAPGLLMFQRVLAEIEAGRLQEAQPLLDELGRRPGFDAENRWQAEWNLARAMQIAGQTEAAYARVNRLLSGAGAGAALPADLRARMAWLRARLSFDAGQHAETVRLLDESGDSLEGASPELRTEIASSGLWLRARAEFALDQAPVALATLEKLRAEYPRSDAAVYSFITEADYYAKRGQTVAAQQRLTKLADDYADSPYASHALYQAAVLAERRGQDTNFEEANKLIEQLAQRYPESDLLFYARLKQGDLLRKLSQFALAQRAYEAVINRFPQHAEVLAAQMSLADCHGAQSSSDSAHAERAVEIYERLLVLPQAPLDLRVEAGFKLGSTLDKRGQTERAQTIWWRDVVTGFLLPDGQAEQLGAKGRYWMGRTLVELGASFERQEKLEQAREAWQLVRRYKLPGESLAEAKLARFLVPGGKP